MPTAQRMPKLRSSGAAVPSVQDSRGNQHVMGRLAETKASEHLQVKGYIILDRNWYCRWGELDIVAKKDGVIVAVEVKSRIHNTGFPLTNITPRKLAKLTFLLKLWLHENKVNEYSVDLRIDAVSVTFMPKLQICHSVGIL